MIEVAADTLCKCSREDMNVKPMLYYDPVKWQQERVPEKPIPVFLMGIDGCFRKSHTFDRNDITFL